MVRTVGEKCPLTEDSFYVTSQHGASCGRQCDLAGKCLAHVCCVVLWFDPEHCKQVFNNLQVREETTRKA